MDLSKAKYLLPNSLTIASLFCGFNAIHISITATSATEFAVAAWLIVAGMLFDAFDGRVARMTQTESELGVQLDSLADAVTFGIAPGFLLYAWGLEPLGMFGKVAAFAFTACAVIRLARFNVMANNHVGVMKYFLGLPTPLAAGAVVSIIMASIAVTGQHHTGAGFSVAAMSLLLGGLMVSNIKYRTFKDVKFRGAAGAGLAAVVLLAVVLGVAFKPSVSFVVLMVIYILIGLLGTVVHWSKSVFGDLVEEDRDSDSYVEEKRRR